MLFKKMPTEESGNCPVQNRGELIGSYKSCLCLLITTVGLTVLIVILAVITPGNHRHASSANVPKVKKSFEYCLVIGNFDSKLYEKLMQDYWRSTTLSNNQQMGTNTLRKMTPHFSSTIQQFTARKFSSVKPSTAKYITTNIPKLFSAETIENLPYTSMVRSTIKEIEGNYKSSYSKNIKGVHVKDENNDEFKTPLSTELTTEINVSTFAPSTMLSVDVDELDGGQISNNSYLNSYFNEKTVSINISNLDIVNDTKDTKLIRQTEMPIASTSSNIFVISTQEDKTNFLKANNTHQEIKLTQNFNRETTSNEKSLKHGNNQTESTFDHPTTKPQEHFVYGGTAVIEKTIIQKQIIEKKCPKLPQVCSTEACKRSASEMIALMDHSVDPCDDFYWYSCHGIDINGMKDRKATDNVLEMIKNFHPNDDLTRKFKQLFDSCVSFSQEDNYKYLETFVEDEFCDTKYDGLDKVSILTDLLSLVLSLNPIVSHARTMPIFDLTVQMDVTGLFIPTLTIPSEASLTATLLNSRDSYEMNCLEKIEEDSFLERSITDIYQSFIDCSSDLNPYILNLNSSLYTIGGFNYLPKLNRSQRIIDVEQSFQFDVFEILGSITKRQRSYNLQHERDNPMYMTVDELQTEYPQINWTNLFLKLFQDRAQNVVKVRVLFKNTLDKIFNFFNTHNVMDIKNLLMAMILHDFYMDLKLVEQKCPASNFCLTVSTYLMEDVAAKFLVSQISNDNLKMVDSDVTNLFEQLKDKLFVSLQTTKWLNQHQRKVLGEHLKEMRINSRAYNLYFNDGVLSYRNSKLELSKTFIENLINVRMNKRKLMYEKITNNPGSVWIYEYNPLDLDIFTNIQRNEVVVPIGLLSKFAKKNGEHFQEYELLGKLGFKIAKAIFSFFTPFNLYKILPELKDNEVLNSFLEIELSDPPIIKFSNIFGVTMTKEDLQLSTDERFSDDAGLLLALELLSKEATSKADPFLWLNLTRTQLFYITFVQEYCIHLNAAEQAIDFAQNSVFPNYFRMNSIMMNSENFADSFGCSLGSSQNPEFKVKQFPRIDQEGNVLDAMQ